MTTETIRDDYVTVADAAGLLKVSISSIRRWIDDGTLRAYRLGHRRVLLRRSELDHAVVPARPPSEQPLGDPVHERLTDEEVRRGLAAIAELRRLSAEILEQRGGKLFRSSGEVLNELRDERTADLAERP